MIESMLVGTALVLVLLGGAVGFVLIFAVVAPILSAGFYYISQSINRLFDERVPSRRKRMSLNLSRERGFRILNQEEGSPEGKFDSLLRAEEPVHDLRGTHPNKRAS